MVYLRPMAPLLAPSTFPPLAIGILGAGRQGLRLLDAASRLPGATVIGVGTEHSKRMELPGIDLCSYEELLNKPGLDAVLIALPNSLHAHWSRKALERGLHVLCEKPLCLTVAEAKPLMDAQRTSKRVLCEAFSYPFHPQHDSLKALLDARRLGPLELLEAHFQYSLGDTSDIRLKADLGGGALNDVGCYLIDWARRTAQSPLARCHAISRTDMAVGVDVATHLQLGFENGIVAHLTCGSDLPRENWCRITGREGTVEVHRAFLVPPGSKCTVEGRTSSGPLRETFTGADQTTTMLEQFLAACREPHLVDPRFSDWQGNVSILERVRLACGSGRGE